VVFPALSAAVISWVPLPERARFVSFAVQGMYLHQKHGISSDFSSQSVPLRYILVREPE